ncbi:Chaperone protein ClpC1 chloroplastic [Bienertia sinuspersici]
MTSNVGSSVIEKGGHRIGFDLDYDEKDNSHNRIKSLITQELKQYFRPEFLNKLDEKIVFRQLTKHSPYYVLISKYSPVHQAQTMY